MAGSPSREDQAKAPRHELGMDSLLTPLLNREHANGYAPLENENVDRVPLCPPDHHHQSEGLVSLDGLAAVVRRDIQNAIRPVEGKLTSLQTVLNTRMDSMEGVLQQHDVKIAKWEVVRDHDGEECRLEIQDKIDETILDLQKQIDKVGGGHAMPAADVAKTLVLEVGGLQRFDSLFMATGWLTLKIKELQGPMLTGTYMKTPSIRGLMFVKFRNGYERDLAVGVLRSARLKHGDENVCGPRKTFLSQSEQGNCCLWAFDGNWVSKGLFFRD